MGHEQYGNSRILFYTNGMIGITCVLLFSMLVEGGQSDAIFMGKVDRIEQCVFPFLGKPN